MLSPSKDDTRRIGAELKRWSQRPIRATNARALGLCTIVLVMMLVAAKHSPDPAAAIRGIATMFVIFQGTVHFMALGMLRGLWRASIDEAGDAIASVRDPARISSLDLAALWTLVALLAGRFE